MDHQDLRTLKLLEEIDKDETPSQRDLSRKLNISLGLVNSFIKRLGSKRVLQSHNDSQKQGAVPVDPQRRSRKDTFDL